MYVCLSVCLPACLPAWLAAWLAGWLAVCLSVCLCVCVHITCVVYVWITSAYVCTHTHIYIYIHRAIKCNKPVCHWHWISIRWEIRCWPNRSIFLRCVQHQHVHRPRLSRNSPRKMRIYKSMDSLSLSLRWEAPKLLQKHRLVLTHNQ